MQPMKNNVVVFPLNDTAKWRQSVRNPAPKIPDEALEAAYAEIERIVKSEKSERSRQ